MIRHLLLPVLMLSVSIPVFAQEPPITAADEQIVFADRLLERNFLESACVEYSRFLSKWPEHEKVPQALFRLGECYFRLGQHEDALGAYRQVTSKHADHPLAESAAVRAGWSCYQLKQYKEAVDWLEKLLNSGSKSEAALLGRYYLGRSQQAMGDSSKAVETFQTLQGNLAADHTLRPQTDFALAEVLELAGNNTEAAAAFEELGLADGFPESFRVESLYRAAEIRQSQGDRQKAAEIYRVVIEKFPDSARTATVRYSLAKVLLEDGKPEEALDAADAYLESEEGGAYREATEFLRGLALMQLERFGDARTAFAALGAKGGEFAEESAYRVCQADFSAGQYEQVLQDCTDFLALRPDSGYKGEIRYLEGMAWFNLGDFDNAKQHLAWSFHDHPKNPYAEKSAYWLAWCDWRQGSYSEAAKAFGDFADAFPRSSDANEALYKKGESFLVAGFYDKAADSFQQVLEKFPTGPFVVDSVYRVALAQYNGGKYDEMVQTFERLLQNHPDSDYRADANFYLGWNLQRESDFDGAKQRYVKALEMAKRTELRAKIQKGIADCEYREGNEEKAADLYAQLIQSAASVALPADTYKWTASFFADRGQAERARAIFEKALDSHDQNVDLIEFARFGIAQTYVDESNWDDAARSLRSFLKDFPQSYLVHEGNLMLASCLTETGKDSEAQELLTKTLESDRPDIRARAEFSLGKLLMKQKQWEDARSYFMRVAYVYFDAELTPQAYLLAGECFETLGEPDKALSLYEELIKEFPNSEEAKESLRRKENLSS